MATAPAVTANGYLEAMESGMAHLTGSRTSDGARTTVPQAKLSHDVGTLDWASSEAPGMHVFLLHAPWMATVCWS